MGSKKKEREKDLKKRDLVPRLLSTGFDCCCEKGDCKRKKREGNNFKRGKRKEKKERMRDKKKKGNKREKREKRRRGKRKEKS